MRNNLKISAIAGNVIFIVWILYNGFNEGFHARLIEKISYIGLLGLLSLNSILLARKKPNAITKIEQE
jgi:hypothetical protein